jgi:hypothetical protein
VFPGGTTTSTGATSPTRAGAPTYTSIIRYIRVSFIWMQKYPDVNRPSMQEALMARKATHNDAKLG